MTEDEDKDRLIFLQRQAIHLLIEEIEDLKSEIKDLKSHKIKVQHQSEEQPYGARFC